MFVKSGLIYVSYSDSLIIWSTPFVSNEQKYAASITSAKDEMFR